MMYSRVDSDSMTLVWPTIYVENEKRIGLCARQNVNQSIILNQTVVYARAKLATVGRESTIACIHR